MIVTEVMKEILFNFAGLILDSRNLQRRQDDFLHPGDIEMQGINQRPRDEDFAGN